ncbi:MAG: patatin-like phospholipase family protein [Proteobacteria bacterium]|nr:patatin-like phospholipase family protein [Pseudomonadota bacterium]
MPLVFQRLLHIFILFVLLPGGALQAEDNNRASIGLVLAGGGARGIAHAGVITALEEMHIPIDAIAGTSMGALVGGLYATGMTGDELKEVIFTMDWEAAFEDSVDRGELPMRRKNDDYDYPSQVQVSFKDGGVALPLGIVEGQQVRLMIKELMKDAAEIHDFDKLPTPFRAVATDLETGDAYIFSDGDIVTAMRASMSLPGLLAPVEHEGRLLVDGGLANNIPVDVARSMNVDRLIVIDIGTPLMNRDEITSLLSVADQVLGFLTRKNSLYQLETLGENDLLIRPTLEGVGMLDFDQQAVIFQSGYDAAMALKEDLQALAVDNKAWDQYVTQRHITVPVDSSIYFVAVENDSRVSDEMISRRITQPIGEPLDRELLSQDIAKIYALGYWDLIDFEVQHEDAGSGLLIKARGKTWGGNKLKFGMNLITDMDGTSDFNLGASYTLKGLNALGGEVYARAQFGDTVLLSGEFYQPLDLDSRFFLVPYLGWQDRQVLTLGPEFNLTDVIGAWRVRDLRGQLAAGVNLFNNSEFRLGAFRGYGDYEVDVASDPSLIEDTFNEGGVFASYRFDSLDNSFFPTTGAFLYANFERQDESMGASNDFDNWQLFAQAAYSFGKESGNTVLLTARLAQSEDATSEPQNYYQLGGLFNLSGLSQNFYSGRQMAFVMAQYQRRLSDRSVLPIDMPVYAGFSVEGGQLWSEHSDIDYSDLIVSGSIYLAIDSPLGPIYFAYGRTNESQDAIYLALGWPFLSNNTTPGR